jgi:hypothetical protein
MDSFDGGDSEAFSVRSSPLSTAFDTSVLEASAHATYDNALSLNSEQSSNGDYVRVNGKAYSRGARRELGLLRHAWLAGDDRLWNVEQGGMRTQTGRDRQFSIDSNSWVFHSCGRVP